MKKTLTALKTDERRAFYARLSKLPSANADDSSCPIWRAIPLIRVKAAEAKALKQAFNNPEAMDDIEDDDESVGQQSDTKALAPSRKRKTESDSVGEADDSDTPMQSDSSPAAAVAVKKEEDSIQPPSKKVKRSSEK